MGDRSNIKVTYEDGNSVYLYSHWDGSRNIDIVREAVALGQRIGDSAYFTRILFGKMIEGDPHGTTGYGISTFMPDNDHSNPIVHVRYPRWGNGGDVAITLEDEAGNEVQKWRE